MPSKILQIQKCSSDKLQKNCSIRRLFVIEQILGLFFVVSQFILLCVNVKAQFNYNIFVTNLDIFFLLFLMYFIGY